MTHTDEYGDYDIPDFTAADVMDGSIGLREVPRG
jgi:hypothetical protein